MVWIIYRIIVLPDENEGDGCVTTCSPAEWTDLLHFSFGLFEPGRLPDMIASQTQDSGSEWSKEKWRWVVPGRVPTIIQRTLVCPCGTVSRRLSVYPCPCSSVLHPFCTCTCWLSTRALHGYCDCGTREHLVMSIIHLITFRHVPLHT